MWCDWSSSATDVRHACCSDRQLLNSGVTGKMVGRACASRSRLDGASSAGDGLRERLGHENSFVPVCFHAMHGSISNLQFCISSAYTTERMP